MESFLILSVCAEENTDEVIKKINKELRSFEIEEIEKANFNNRFLKSANNIGTIVNSLASLYTIGTGIINAVTVLIQ